MINLHPLILAFIVIQLLVLLLLLYLFSFSKKKLDSRYLILTTLCLIYNFSNGLIPNSNFITDIRSQYYITFAIGILTSCYSFYYIHHIHNIKIFNLNYVKGIITGFCIWYILSFVSLYSITNNLSLCRIIFFMYPVGISFFWFYKFKLWFTDYHINWSNQIKIKVYSGLIAMISLFSFPLILILFEDNRIIERTVYNIGFLSISYFFFYKLFFYKSINHDKIDINFLNNLKFNLTKRQKEIVIQVYENPRKSYTELAEKLNISSSTFTTHTTNIYKNLDIKDKSKKGLISFIEDKKGELLG